MKSHLKSAGYVHIERVPGHSGDAREEGEEWRGSAGNDIAHMCKKTGRGSWVARGDEPK